MADYADWGGGDGGGGGGGVIGGIDFASTDETDAFGSKFTAEKDSVLFAIDCRASMFVQDFAPSPEDAVAAPPVVDPETGAIIEGATAAAPTAGGGGGGGAPKTTTYTQGASPFSRAVRAAFQFYQDKVITSDKDVSGILLFGANHQLNPFDFPNVFVFHEMDCPSASRVQELEVLSKAGEFDASSNPGSVEGNARSPLYAEFEQYIGHYPEVYPSADPAATPKKKPLGLSDVLWASQHMFRHLPNAGKIAFKRIFLFTCDEDPTFGAPVEKDKCFARMKDLAEGGVNLDVFVNGAPSSGVAGDGTTVAGGTTHGTGTGSSSNKPSGTPSSSGPSATPASLATAGHRSPSPGHSQQQAGSHSATTTTKGRSPPGTGSGGHSKTTGTTTGASGGGASAGGSLPTRPHAFDKTKFWDKLLTPAMQAMKYGAFDDDYKDEGVCGEVHVQDCESDDPFEQLMSQIRVRTFPQRTNGQLPMTLGVGANVPSIHVGIYLPVMRCKKPSFVWLESSTNALIASESRAVDPSTGAEVAQADVLVEGKVGGAMVKFRPEEIAKMKGQFGPPGLQILCFKNATCLSPENSICRSAFVSPSESVIKEEHEACDLFQELLATLLEQDKVAIAQLIAREGAAPRLVALVPSRKETEVIEAVRGLGFHMVYLPYADDTRSLRFPKFDKPPEAAINKAKRIIRKLSVEYDPSAIANPSLQRQYHHLQQLALMDDSKKAPPDFSLPDHEGMSRYSKVFQDFSDEVYPPGYNPELVIPSTKTKPPPTKEELAAIDFDALEASDKLSTLTVLVLKEYLKSIGEATSGLKQELVDRASVVIKRKRGKRNRDD